VKIVWNAIWYFARRGLKLGVILGASYGTVLFFLFPISTVYGLVCGGIVGLVAGAGCGLLAGLVTVCFFYPLTDPLIYRRVVMISCSTVGFGGALSGFSLLFQTEISEAFLAPGIPLIVIPSLIATGAAAYVSRGFAIRYATEKRQKKEKPKREVIYG